MQKAKPLSAPQRDLFLLPWLFFLLGLSPLALEGFEAGGRGADRLLVGFLLAAVGSLYSRFPAGFAVRLALVLGFGLLGFQATLEGAMSLADLPPPPPLGGLLGVLALGGAFLLGTGREAPALPAIEKVGTEEDLHRLAGALEGLSLRHPLLLLYLAGELPEEALGREAHGAGLAFRLKQGEYLLVLQGRPPEEVHALLKRLQSQSSPLAYAVEYWRGKSLEGVLSRLRAEAVLQGGKREG